MIHGSGVHILYRSSCLQQGPNFFITAAVVFAQAVNEAGNLLAKLFDFAECFSLACVPFWQNDWRPRFWFSLGKNLGFQDVKFQLLLVNGYSYCFFQVHIVTNT